MSLCRSDFQQACWRLRKKCVHDKGSIGCYKLDVVVLRVSPD
ncbi:hypothetical protein CABS01_12678 [Colletotrichum abscissum]|nr:uncharacterized protein CABS01_12678 [Colletotrichum abscissum]KAK1489527.1 hypothetical protein CABS01_12678 [Colletotrichum abscissum]